MMAQQCKHCQQMNSNYDLNCTRCKEPLHLAARLAGVDCVQRVARWLRDAWLYHKWFTSESRAFAGPYTLRDRLYWPIAWRRFMAASLRDRKPPSEKLTDCGRERASQPE